MYFQSQMIDMTVWIHISKKEQGLLWTVLTDVQSKLTRIMLSMLSYQLARRRLWPVFAFFYETSDK